MSEAVHFTKMVALGNDFVVLDVRNGQNRDKIDNFSRFARSICTRKRSIGADGILLLEDTGRADIIMRVFNPDGGEVAMCGNGARCIAYYYALKSKKRKLSVSIQTKAGIIKAAVEDDVVRIGLTESKILKDKFRLKLGGKTIEVSSVNTGVPHVVHFVEDIDSVDVKKLGKKIRFHNRFKPEGANANFVKVKNPHTILVRTYERGVEEETFACGTGAAASAIISAESKGVASPVKVKTRGGDILYVYFKKRDGKYENLILEGEVKLVYEGSVNYV